MQTIYDNNGNIDNVNQMSNKSTNGIVFYDKMNICSAQSLRFTDGTYQGDDNPGLVAVKKLKPMMMKIEPLTTVEIMTQVDKYVYNNPYDDRFVVVKLSSGEPIEITGYIVRRYINTETVIDKNGIYISFIDLLIIMLVIMMIWLCCTD
jgi:hypothetical protein